MFFLMGITENRKNFDFNQLITCEVCGSYGRYHIFMTYMVLSLFFIPCFKWNKHYYVKTSCCNTLYELDQEIGKRIARGEKIEILPHNLTKIQNNREYDYSVKRCRNCGFQTTENFEYCPKCGTRF